ncbi:hypothetical protein K1719_023793 [Acacia pycnantha]|nr:hypothetical protein K1719_023793 [Acacia pycnantha]
MQESLNEKEVPEPLPEESLRSTKEVRIRSVEEGGKGDGLGMSDVPMVEVATAGDASYRSKLLNLDQVGASSRLRNGVELTEADYQIGCDGDIPYVEFSSRIKDVLVQGMECTAILKFLGRSINYKDLLARSQALWQL